MINDQLQCHLDEFSITQSHAKEEATVAPNSKNRANSDTIVTLISGIKLKDWFLPIGGNSSRENVFRILTLVPLIISVAKSGDILLRSCLFFALLGILYRCSQPSECLNEVSTIRVDTNHQQFQKLSSKSINSTNFSEGSSETEVANLKRLRSCRLRVTTMLGLVGAPPLENFQGFIETRILSRGQHSSSQVLVSDSVINAVVDFAQAHVELLLALDQAYYWLQVTSGVHMGLGPMASCIERVERAALAREYRENNNGITRRDADRPIVLEPQRTIGKSKVVALAPVRKNLAQVIVNESRSLSSFISAETPRSGQGVTAANNEEMIELPEIISLAWIKSSRHQLAVTLSRVLQKFCELKNLRDLSFSSCPPREYGFNDSTFYARELKAHIVSTILLDTSDDCNRLFKNTPLTIEYSAVPSSLDNSLGQLHEHLDALRCSLWACRHYGLTTTAPTNANQNLNADQTEWWTHIQKLSRAVRVIEEEINSKFLPPAGTSENADTTLLNPSSAQAHRSDSGDYEDSNTPVTVTAAPHKSEHVQAKKTLVFSGHGTISDLPRSNPRQGKESSVASIQRDAIAEHLLVKELQNRIGMISPPAEVELSVTDENKVSPEQSAEGSTNAPATSYFLGATGSLLSELKNSLPLAMDSNHSQQWEVEN